MACHDRILQRLDTLERVAGSIETNRDEALRAAQAVIRFFDTNGNWHTQDEEESLFPRLAATAGSEDLNYLTELEAQHQTAEQVYAELKQTLLLLSGNPDAEAMARFRSLAAQLCAIYRAHIASENQRLIAISARILTKEQIAEMALEMKLRRGLGNE